MKFSLTQSGKIAFYTPENRLYPQQKRGKFIVFSPKFALFRLIFVLYCAKIRSIVCQPRIIRTPPKRRYFRAFRQIRLRPYGEYEQSRLHQKSSKIAVFWLPASLASRFQVKTRRANALIYEYKTVAEQSISLKTRRKTEFKHNHLWLTIASQLQSPYEYLR